MITATEREAAAADYGLARVQEERIYTAFNACHAAFSVNPDCPDLRAAFDSLYEAHGKAHAVVNAAFARLGVTL
jgi:hypothetical protein